MTTTIASFAIRHILFAEVIRDANAIAPRVDAWRDGAWNIRAGRYQVSLTIDPVGRGIAKLARDGADWTRGTFSYIALRLRGEHRALAGVAL